MEDELGENRVAELAENRVSFRIRISVVCFGCFRGCTQFRQCYIHRRQTPGSPK